VLSLDIRLFVLSLSTWGASEGIINRQVILKTGGFYSATSANFYLVFDPFCLSRGFDLIGH
jgi:hypothetical protein